jgi:RimJ/RimL family protein N-acetyltransferase
MKTKHWKRVDEWVSDLLGVPTSMLWQPGVSVGMHSGLGDHPGIVVIGRENAAHVSLPGWAGRKLAAALTQESPSDLLDRKFWKKLRATEHHHVAGPRIHAFTSTPLEMPGKVEQIDASDIAHWRELVSRRKWEKSGFAGEVPVAFAVRAGDDIAAAANLTLFRGVASDVGVLTHPKYRGKGYASRVARAAASYAVRNHELARYRADADDARAQSISTSLGFEPYFQHVAVMPR